MPSSLRSRLFVVSLCLVALAMVAGGAVLEFSLRSSLMEMVEVELTRSARGARETLRTLPESSWPAGVQGMANRLGEATQLRLTVIDSNGSVVGDSMVDEEELTELDDHRSRPEVIEALEQGLGVSQRHSSTLGQDMLYIAVPVAAPSGDTAVVRAAKPLEHVHALIWAQRRWVLLSGFVGVLVATGMSWLSTFWVTAGLRQLVVRSRALARPDDASGPDELEMLSGSLDSLSEALEATVRELADERHRFRSVLDGMAEATLTLDSRGYLDIANPAARDLLAPAPLTIGTPLEELLGDESLKRMLEAGLGGTSVTDSIELVNPERCLDVSISPLERGGCIAVLHDVTDLRRLERVRRDFVANVSHELRTPVQALRATAELLIGSVDEEERAWLTDTLVRNSSRLGSLVSDLLDLSSIEAGQYPMRPEAVQILGVVQEALAAVPDRGRTVTVQVPADAYAWCDARALGQVVVNLVDNATRHAAESGAVVIWAHVDAELRLEVRDDGEGISEEHRSRVFERFYRVDAGHSRTHGGTGLGLSIVRHLVSEMGGVVSIHDAEPRGTCMRLTLPALQKSSVVAPVDVVDVGAGRQ